MTTKQSFKLTLIGMLTALSLFITFVTTPTTAQATTWHKGTPTALRGTWVTKSQNGYGPDIIAITKTTLTSSGSVSNSKLVKPSFHHKSGSLYYDVKARDARYSGWTVTLHYKYGKTGHKFKVQNDAWYHGKKLVRIYATWDRFYYKK